MENWPEQKQHKDRKTWIHIFQALALIVVIGLAFYLADLARGSETVRMMVARFGYVGIFLISVLSGFNFAVPIPAIAFLPLFLEAELNFWVTIFLITAGMSLADTIAYALGRVGGHLYTHSAEAKVLTKLEQIRERYRWAPMTILFLFAALAPLPNELLIIPFGFLGYRLVYIFPVVFTGNLIFNFIYSMGVISLFEFL